MLNRYYGWYAHTGDLAAAERGSGGGARAPGSRSTTSRSSSPSTAPTRSPACTASRRRPWTEEYQAERARDVPPRLRPGRGGRRRADLELRRLRHRAGDHARRRQQEGRLHPRPAAEERPRTCCGGAGGLWHPPDPMRLRRLGRTGRDVSEIGFGAWQIGADWGDGRRGRPLGDAARGRRRRRDVLRHRRRLRRRPPRAALGRLLRGAAAGIIVATKMGRRLPTSGRELHARALPRLDRPLAREPRRGHARPGAAALPADRRLLPAGGVRGAGRAGRRGADRGLRRERREASRRR